MARSTYNTPRMDSKYNWGVKKESRSRRRLDDKRIVASELREMAAT